MNPSDYASSIGVVKSLETRLLTAHKLRRIAESANDDDFARALADTPYASRKFPDDALDAAQYEELALLLEKYLVDASLREVFLAEHGFASSLAAIKVFSEGDDHYPDSPSTAARRRALIVSPGQLDRTTPRGGVSGVSALIAAVERQRFFGLRPPLGEICRLLTAAHAAPTAVEADFEAYSAFFSWAIAKVAAFPAAGRYFRIRVDAANAANFVGYSALGAARGARSPSKTDFFDGGFIARSVFEEAASAGTEPSELFQAARFHDYKKSFAPGMSGVYTAASASKFSDDAASDYWIKMRLEPFGFHHLCGYAHAKKTEIKNLRIIAAGIRSRVKPDEIKNRLRRAYF
ncbi:MAG: V-type ATPase subunit [Endomicrobiia bacterium]|nr:V-type ATPase subunit [Endomicrobiia bacterium]